MNECEMDPCDVNADCTDTSGSFVCTCRHGYTGDGFTCDGTYNRVLESDTLTVIVTHFHCSFLVAIPPPISLDGNRMVNVGRAFRLACRSVGDFSGAVVWMKDKENVPYIGLY